MKKATEAPRQLKRNISNSIPEKVDIKRARLGLEVKAEAKTMKSVKPVPFDKENQNQGTCNKTSTLVKKSMPPRQSIVSTGPLKNAAVKISTTASATTKSSELFKEIGTAGIKRVSSAAGNASDPAVKGRARRSTLTHSFLVNKNLQQKQLVGKVISDSVKVKKTVLGTLHGKVVQSKINSFRKPVPPGMEKASLVDDSKSESDLQKQKRSSATDKNDCKPGADLRKKRCSVILATERKASQQTKTATTTTVAKKWVPVRPSIGNVKKIEPSGVTVRQSIKNVSELQKKRESLLGTPAAKNKDVCDYIDGNQQTSRGGKRPTARQSILPSSGRTENMPKVAKPDTKTPITRPSQIKTVGVSKVSANTKHIASKETAEQQRAPASSWMNIKGKGMKRQSTFMPPPETAKPVPVEEPVKSFWTTIVEEDEQGAFLDAVNRTLSECTKLIDEGCPKEEVLAILQNLVNNISATKKLAKYWECLARLEEKEGPISNVIAIYEEAIEAEAQPTDVLRNSLAEILKKASTPLKPSHDAVVVKRETDQEVIFASTVAENKGENADNLEEDGIKIENEENPELEPLTASQKRRGRRKKCKLECKLESVEETPNENESASDHTPAKSDDGSSVVKYNVKTTPYLQGVKKNMQCEESSSEIKELKFLTPVRRSRRIECRSGRLPTMLKDHDPAVCTIEELASLEGEINAYVCRQNTALQEVTNFSDCKTD